MRAIFLLVCFISSLVAIQLSEEEQKFLQENGAITMCVDPDWEPFEKINEKGQHEGLAADLIALVSKRLDIEIKLIPTQTWQESLEYSKAGKCDILSFLNETPQRKEWLTFTKPLFSDPNVLVGRIEMDYIKDISKENLSIALPHGTAMAEFFAKDFPNLTIIPTTSEPEAFKLVEEKKADLTLRSLVVAAYTIKNERLFNLKIVGEPKGYENDLRIGVLQNKPLLRDILNRGIQTLTQKDVESILNNHITITIEKITEFTIAIWIFGVLILIILGVLLWNSMLNIRVKKELQKNQEQQKQLLKQEQKAQMGELLANISHQWKNGLTQISSLNLELILMYEMDQEMQKELALKRLKQTEDSIRFMIYTMDTFLNYYKGNSEIKQFDVKKNIEDILKLFGIQIKKSNLEVKIDQAYALQIKAIQNEWHHIWLNLFSNSIQVANKKKIATPKVIITLEKEKITYEDNCGGIEKQKLQEIKQHKQTGLGLKMCEDILNKNGYSLTLENGENGVKFQINLKV